VSRDFPPQVFFHQNIRPGHLIKGLNHFENKFEFAKKFDFLMHAVSVNQRPRGGLFDGKKIEGRKSRDTVPLKAISLPDFELINSWTKSLWINFSMTVVKSLVTVAGQIFEEEEKYPNDSLQSDNFQEHKLET
jgi:hypothetical protein